MIWSNNLRLLTRWRKRKKGQPAKKSKVEGLPTSCENILVNDHYSYSFFNGGMGFFVRHDFYFLYKSVVRPSFCREGLRCSKELLNNVCFLIGFVYKYTSNLAFRCDRFLFRLSFLIRLVRSQDFVPNLLLGLARFYEHRSQRAPPFPT